MPWTGWASAASTMCARANRSSWSSRRPTAAKAKASVEAMCDKLLANTVIENYEIDLVD